ncbi:restriction endonuclease subunit S [Listeria welshimeri]|nr:restriction endonuclease subunit S [Listeria welshimeri]
MKNLEKRVPVIRFKGFSEAWEQRKVLDYAIYTYGGGTPKTNVPEYWSGEIPWIQSSDLSISNLFNINPKKHITELAIKSSATKFIPANSIAIVSRVGVGKLVFMPFEYTTSQDFLSLSNLQVDSNFGVYSIYMMLQRELNNIQGTSIKGITKSDLLEKKINKPSSREEQQKIGSFFKQLDNTIALHQRKLEALKLMKKAFLQQIFPNNEEKVPRVRFVDFDEEWDQRKLGDLGSVVMNRRIFKEETSYKGEIPFYKIGTFGGVANSYITRERFEDYKLKYPYPEKGDVLISASGSIGRVVEYNGEEAYYQDSNIVWLKHDKQLNNLFLKQFYSIVKWSGIEGTTIKRLYNKNILQTEIKVPGIDEQKRIGIFFKQLDNNITRYQSKLEKLSSLKKAYLQRMFI